MLFKDLGPFIITKKKKIYNYHVLCLVCKRNFTPVRMNCELNIRVENCEDNFKQDKLRKHEEPISPYCLLKEVYKRLD